MFDYQKLYAGEQVCATCVHYVQHYRRDIQEEKEVYLSVACGHCLKRRPKRYPPEAPACELWQPDMANPSAITK